MGSYKGDQSGKHWPQIIAIIVACIPGLSSALLFSWPSPFLLVLTNDKSRYNISENEATLIPIFLPIGMSISSMLFFRLPDKIGRKYTLLLLSIPQGAFWIITIFARDIYSIYVSRFICGIADGIMYAALPTYIGEVASPKIRGTWGNGQTCSFNFGFLLINILGSYFTIQQTAYICLTLPSLSAILFLWMPESPYYYLMKGQDGNARTTLRWLTRKGDIESDFVQLKRDVERQISETGKWRDLYKITSNRKAIFCSVFLRFAQQFAGIAVFETYIQYIFDKSMSESFTPQMSAIIFSALLWIVMSGFSVVLDKMGRRKAFIWSSFSCAIVLLAECLYFYFEESATHLKINLQWFPLTAFIIYVITYSAGIGLLPSLMASELFSASIKGKGLAVTNFLLGVIVTSTALIFQYLTATVGLYSPFAVFSALTFTSFAVSFFIVPETKGKTLEEIQQGLKKDIKS
ncbi:hypothetical protein ABEB36_012431 [Hypothenemus hampei]|uniref:Major facilitator superfamily (MFS) profile domain-containing protein n=1 Tax=Hypothenemus hampei TaxID=57062 RepID=A0ABD1EBC2_HYPHA